MVKVIGKDPKYIKTLSCKNCASVLEYTEAELEEYSGTDYSGYGYTNYYLRCPNCGHDILVRAG